MKLNKLTPNLAVTDVKQTVRFYQDILGFHLIMAVPESQDGIEEQINEQKDYVHALVAKDNVEIMFQRSGSLKEDVVLADQETIGASASFYMEMEDVEEFYNEVSNKRVTATAIKTTWYGMREFYLKDNNGYVLGFAEKS